MKICTTKYTVIWTKWQPEEWESILANYTSDRELISNIHKEHRKLHMKYNNPIEYYIQSILKSRNSNGGEMI